MGDAAWTLRYTMNAILADLEGYSRGGGLNNLDWLPRKNDPSATDYDSCVGITSMVPYKYYKNMEMSTRQEEETGAETEEGTAETASNQEDTSPTLTPTTLVPTKAPTCENAGWFWWIIDGCN